MNAVSLSERGLLIHGREVPVYSGAVHYWRLERARWPMILDRVKELGFNIVETYIPWSVHETAPGAYDWGQQDPRKDLEAFMRMCEERGLWLIVRPGPLINAELTDFGFPEWLLLDAEVQARTAQDTIHLDAAWGLHPPYQFPVPSYASEKFFELVGGWFDAVCPMIARHLAPHGCVIAVQSDNETCYLFFDQPYATDYSVASLELYRAFLASQYGTIEQLNDVYGTAFATFEDVQPPRDGPVATRQALPWHVDWVAYKEFQVRWSVARLARMLRERGLDTVPIFHDVAFQMRTPLDISRMEAEPDIDWVGMNFYRAPWDHKAMADRVRFLAGSTRLPFVPELGAGLWSHHPATPTPAEHEFSVLSALMYGIKAFSFYMLVERDRWQGSPITRHGTLRPEYAPFYARLTSFLHQQQFWRFFRAPRALVLLNYDLGRAAAANARLNYGHADLLGLPPELFRETPDLGFRWDVYSETWPNQVMETLRRHSLDFDLADTHVGSERMARYSVVFAHAADFMAVQDQQRLAAFHGALVLGPGVPYLDSRLRPCRILDRFSPTSEAALAVTVSRLIPKAEYCTDDARAEVVPHHDGERTLLFVSNPTPEAVCATLCFEGARQLACVWGPPRSEHAQGELRVELPGYSVQVWSAST
jgi:beta-galactosidase